MTTERKLLIAILIVYIPPMITGLIAYYVWGGMVDDYTALGTLVISSICAYLFFKPSKTKEL